MVDPDKTVVIETGKAKHGVKEGMIMVWTTATPFSKIIGMVLIVFACISGVQAAVINNEQKQLQECQIAFMEDMVDTVEARGNATTLTQEAMDNLVTEIQMTMNDGKRGGVGEAFVNYKKARAEALAKRAANPYPEVSLTEECQR